MVQDYDERAVTACLPQCPRCLRRLAPPVAFLHHPWSMEPVTCLCGWEGMARFYRRQRTNEVPTADR